MVGRPPLVTARRYDREEKAVQAAVKARQRPPPFSHAHDDAAAQRKDAQRRLFLAVTEATGPLATSYLAMKQVTGGFQGFEFYKF